MKPYLCKNYFEYSYMKNSLTCFVLALVLFGCKKEQKETLTFKSTTLQSEPCTSCPTVSISIPEAIENSKLGIAINDAITQAVVLELIYDDNVEINTLDEAVQSFKTGFLDLKKMYPDESLGWEAKIDGEISYEDAGIIAVKIESYIFTGGAHGQSTTRFLNFDKKKAVQLEASELFKEGSSFLAYVEREFRLQEQIPDNTSINSTGFMFEEDEFYLPETIGYTDVGIQLIYEQYEIASYADGPITLVLPYAEIRPYLALPLTKDQYILTCQLSLARPKLRPNARLHERG